MQRMKERVDLYVDCSKTAIPPLPSVHPLHAVSYGKWVPLQTLTVYDVTHPLPCLRA